MFLMLELNVFLEILLHISVFRPFTFITNQKHANKQFLGTCSQGRNQDFDSFSVIESSYFRSFQNMKKNRNFPCRDYSEIQT